MERASKGSFHPQIRLLKIVVTLEEESSTIYRSEL